MAWCREEQEHGKIVKIQLPACFHLRWIQKEKFCLFCWGYEFVMHWRNRVLNEQFFSLVPHMDAKQLLISSMAEIEK